MKCQSDRLVKRIQTIRRQQPTNFLRVFDHFGGLALKGLVWIFLQYLLPFFLKVILLVILKLSSFFGGRGGWGNRGRHFSRRLIKYLYFSKEIITNFLAEVTLFFWHKYLYIFASWKYIKYNYLLSAAIINLIILAPPVR